MVEVAAAANVQKCVEVVEAVEMSGVVTERKPACEASIRALGESESETAELSCCR